MSFESYLKWCRIVLDKDIYHRIEQSLLINFDIAQAVQ